MLDDLYSQYQEDGRFDHLRNPGINFVPGCGPLNPKLMIIGEAPGRMENAARQPFVGPAGKVLTDLLGNVGIYRYSAFITNVVKYWPQDSFNTRTPTNEEIEAHREFIKEEIKIVNPLLVALCGRPAIQAIFPKNEKIHDCHGKLLEGFYVPLYHPARVIHDPSSESIVQAGYIHLKNHLDEKIKASEATKL